MSVYAEITNVIKSTKRPIPAEGKYTLAWTWDGERHEVVGRPGSIRPLYMLLCDAGVPEANIELSKVYA